MRTSGLVRATHEGPVEDLGAVHARALVVFQSNSCVLVGYAIGWLINYLANRSTSSTRMNATGTTLFMILNANIKRFFISSFRP